METHVREANARDVPAVAALWEQMMDFHAVYDARFRFAPNARREYEKHLVSTIRSQGARVFVAVHEDQVVGFLMAEVHARKPVYPVGRYGFISDLSVAERCRRQGVGRALFAAAQRWFERERVTAVELYVAEANPVSTAFWDAMGFTHYLRLVRRELRRDDVGDGACR